MALPSQTSVTVCDFPNVFAPQVSEPQNPRSQTSQAWPRLLRTFFYDGAPAGGGTETNTPAYGSSSLAVGTMSLVGANTTPAGVRLYVARRTSRRSRVP